MPRHFRRWRFSPTFKDFLQTPDKWADSPDEWTDSYGRVSYHSRHGKRLEWRYPTELITNKRKRSPSRFNVASQEPASLYWTLSEEKKQTIRPFAFLELPAELRCAIFEYLMSDNLTARTIDFDSNNKNGNDWPLLGDDFLPEPLFKSNAMLRACKQTRADFLGVFIRQAHFRLLVRNLNDLPIKVFRHHFCEDPQYGGSPQHSVRILSDLLPVIRRLTLWIDIPAEASLKAFNSWSFLEPMTGLQELEIVFYDSKFSNRSYDSYRPNLFGRFEEEQVSIEILNKQGGSFLLAGMFVDLLSKIAAGVSISFRDSAAEARGPPQSNIPKNMKDSEDESPACWNPQSGHLYVNPHKEWSSGDDQYMKSRNKAYERHYGPAQPVKPKIMYGLYKRFKLLQGSGTRRDDEDVMGISEV